MILWQPLGNALHELLITAGTGLRGGGLACAVWPSAAAAVKEAEAGTLEFLGEGLAAGG